MYSDFKYVVDGSNKGWAQKWERNSWIRTKTGRPENVDLWSELLEPCEKHKVTFKWVRVKDHSGNPETERGDKLAMKAMSKKGLPPDRNYEEGKTQIAL